MAYFLIDNGIVIQKQPNAEDGFVEGPDDVVCGYAFDGHSYAAPSPSPIVPVIDEISDRQFFQALYLRDHISKAEALAAIGTGAIPAAMQALIDQLPEEQQEPAEFLLTGATTFKASHPIADMIRVLFGWSVEQKDEFWQFAASL